MCTLARAHCGGLPRRACFPYFWRSIRVYSLTSVLWLRHVVLSTQMVSAMVAVAGCFRKVLLWCGQGSAHCSLPVLSGPVDRGVGRAWIRCGGVAGSYMSTWDEISCRRRANNLRMFDNVVPCLAACAPAQLPVVRVRRRILQKPTKSRRFSVIWTRQQKSS